jgi:hypothetical protein
MPSCPPDCPPTSPGAPAPPGQPGAGATQPGAFIPTLNPYFSTVLPRFGDLVKYYAALWKSGYTDWWIGVRFGQIAANTTASPLTIRVSGYRFLALAIVGVSDLPNHVLVKLTEAQPSNPLMNDFLSVRNLAGDGSRPNLLFVPRVLEFNQSIIVEAKNVHSTTASNYTEIVLRGVRFYTEYEGVK